MESFYLKVEEILKKDVRYKPDSYEFVMQALYYTQNKLERKGHLSGRDLLDGIKEFALEQFGTMAKPVLEHWGLHATDDFGNIVFNMVDNGLLSKTENDSAADFHDVYKFSDVFKEEL